MTKEYHCFTHQQKTHEQAFIFEVQREGEYVHINELWLITTQKEGEVKTRVNLEKMFQLIGQTVGGNLDDDGVEIVVNMFEDVLPKEKQLEIQFELCEKELEKTSINSADKLIRASELSKRIDDQVGNISGIVNDIINKR